MFFQRFESLCIKSGSDVSNTLRALNLSTSKGTAWRNGSVPNGEILLKIALHFNVSIDYLLGRTDDPSPAEQKEKPPAQGGELSMYYQLTPENRARADSYLAFLLAEQQKDQT